MQLETLVCFYEIANGKTFLEVADNHNLSQSALSKSIKKLESDLGFTLLDRSSRKVKLTPAGWQIMQDLNGVTELYDKLMSHTAQLNNNQRISISLMLPGNILRIKPIIHSFEKDHPEILLSLGQIRRNPLLKSDADPVWNDSDFIVQHKPLVRPEGIPDPEYDILYEDAVVALIPRSHPLASKPSLCFSDLQDQPVMINFWGRDFLPELVSYTGISLNQVTVIYKSREDLAWQSIIEQKIVLFYASDMYMFQSRDIVVRPLEDLPMQPIILITCQPDKLPAGAQILKTYILNAVRSNPIHLTDCCELPG